MTIPVNTQATAPASHSPFGGIRGRVLAMALGSSLLALLAVLMTAIYLSSALVRHAETVSAESLRLQAEKYLTQINASVANQSSLILDRAARDAQSVAFAAGAVYGGRVDLPKTYSAMRVGPEGQLMNSSAEISSVFVPSTTWSETDYNRELYEAVQRDIEISSYMDLTMQPIKENNPNTSAVYIGTARDVLRYYPNINIGEVVPADFRITQRPWYLSALTENQGRPQPAPVWSPVYYDATGLGMVTTVAIPIYTAQQDLVGVVGMDITLKEVQVILEGSKFESSGYSFLMDKDGSAIILPAQGFQDFLGSAPDPAAANPNLVEGVQHPEMISVLQQMQAGKEGFAILNLDGRELYVAYTPLRQPSEHELTVPGWSLASVVPSAEVLSSVATLQEKVRQASQAVLIQQIVPVGLLISIGLILVAWFSTSRLVRPILKLALAAEQLGSGEWDQPLPALKEVHNANKNEIGVLANTLATMAGHLRQSFGQLEQRVAERTLALEHRSRQMQTAAVVARDIARAQDLKTLLDSSVDLISRRLGYYSVGIFLVEDTGEYAVLSAASGDLSQSLLERQIRLRVGQQGIVGYVTRFGQARRSDDVTQDGMYQPEALLADTRSELTLPLRSGYKIIGALDVQSTLPHAFTDDDTTILQTLADQLATAIENVRLSRDLQKTLEETEQLYQQGIRQSWVQLTSQSDVLGFVYDQQGVRPLTQLVDHSEEGENHPPSEPGLQIAGFGRRTQPDSIGPAGLQVPVMLRGGVIGTIGLESDDADHVWTDDELAIIGATANQAALTVENARLLAESQRRAASERIAADVVSHLRASLEVQTVLTSAVQEIALQVGLPEVMVELIVPEDDADSEPLEDGMQTIDEDGFVTDRMDGLQPNLDGVENASQSDEWITNKEILDDDCEEAPPVPSFVGAVKTNGNRPHVRRLRSLGRNRHGAA